MNWLKSKKLLNKFGINFNLAKMTVGDQVRFFSAINGFLKNGFSLLDALDFYSTLNDKDKMMSNEIRRKLSSGSSFSNSVQCLVNNNLYYQIKIAEYHGNLIESLDKINQFLIIKKHQKEKLISLLIYPFFLLVLLLGIITTVHLFITPQLHEPAQNHGFHGIKWELVGLGIIMASMIILSLIRYRQMNKVDRVNLMFKIPVIKRLYHYYYAYYLSSNLALMMRCGMDFRQIIDFMCKMKRNLVLESLGKEIKRLINYGGDRHELKSKFSFIPLKMLILMDSGDSSQVLAQKLESYSRLCFNKLVKLSYRLIGLVQPVMFLIIGLVIAVTYLNMLLPMYDSIKGVY